MRAYVACVGLIVLVGCFTLVIAPDSAPDPRQILFSGRLPTIVIDAGHGGNDGGAKSRAVVEKVLTLELALRLEAILHERGFTTVLTRSDDRYISLADRVAVANQLDGPALFVSLHFNKGSEGYISGIETFYASVKTPPPRGWTWVGFFNPQEELDTGETLAAEVQSALVAKTGARDRGIRASKLYVTRHTRAPAILIEGGFLTNVMESSLLLNRSYTNRLAEGIAEGVERWCEAQPRRAPGTPGPLAKAE